MLKSKLGSHNAGSGVILAFYESEETYRDYKCNRVRFPHDNLSKEKYASLCGKVEYKRLEDIK
jgi:CRISPR/Cas system CMR-associated protein Cmr1 (group 7 of RAMP superfamily)